MTLPAPAHRGGKSTYDSLKGWPEEDAIFLFPSSLLLTFLKSSSSQLCFCAFAVFCILYPLRRLHYLVILSYSAPAPASLSFFSFSVSSLAVFCVLFFVVFFVFFFVFFVFAFCLLCLILCLLLLCLLYLSLYSLLRLLFQFSSSFSLQYVSFIFFFIFFVVFFFFSVNSPSIFFVLFAVFFVFSVVFLVPFENRQCLGVCRFKVGFFHVWFHLHIRHLLKTKDVGLHYWLHRSFSL